MIIIDRDVVENLKALEYIKEQLKTNPNIVKEILIEAGIQNEDGSLVSEYIIED